MWVRAPPALLMTKFLYNGQVYAPANLEKKLKKLGITLNDIEIIPDEQKEQKQIFPEQRPYTHTYRVNVNTVLCAYSQEDLDRLKQNYIK